MSKHADRPIGIFDSGVGGLTVVSQIIRAMPNENIVYFGDCARAPYGDRTPEQLAHFSRQIIDFLTSKNIKALVVACGTISARIFDAVLTMTDVPTIGMVAPAVEAVLDATVSGKMAVLATAGTIASRAHQTAINAQMPDAVVAGISCPLFVPLVEEGWTDGQVPFLVAQKYLAPLKDSGIDTVLLGCTHYPLLADSIASAAPPDTKIIDPAFALAENLKTRLAAQGLLRAKTTQPAFQFYISGRKEKFEEIAARVLGHEFEANVVKF